MMLIEVDAETFKKYFPLNPHPFVSEAFIDLNQKKAERVVRLAEDVKKPVLGLIAGINSGILESPFSAPFGGFHFRKEIMKISEITIFINSLKDYVFSQGLSGIKLTLPPDIYNQTFNAKTINSLILSGFHQETPDITGWIDLEQYDGSFSQKNSRELYRQAVRNGLSFKVVNDYSEKQVVYNLICENRAKFGRPIYMTLNDIVETSKIWPVDFFTVEANDSRIAASGIFYRNHPKICYAAFWGDNNIGRPLKAMDFLAHNIWNFYKDLGFKFIDIGISTESGIPNDGLLRFKESHDSTSSLRYSFSWTI